jgi:hypothetical protein
MQQVDPFKVTQQLPFPCCSSVVSGREIAHITQRSPCGCCIQELKGAVSKSMEALAAAHSSEEPVLAEGEGAELWAWEPRLDVRGVIKKVQEEQRGILSATLIRLERASTILQRI